MKSIRLNSFSTARDRDYIFIVKMLQLRKRLHCLQEVKYIYRMYMGLVNGWIQITERHCQFCPTWGVESHYLD